MPFVRRLLGLWPDRPVPRPTPPRRCRNARAALAPSLSRLRGSLRASLPHKPGGIVPWAVARASDDPVFATSSTRADGSKRRVGRVSRPEETDPELNGSEACAANGGRSYRPVIDISALYEEKWVSTRLAESADLGPEPSYEQRGVQIANPLPLHKRLATNRVVPVTQTASDDDRAECLQFGRNRASPLKHVNGDFGSCHALTSHSATVLLSSAPDRKQLALLRSKNA